MQSATTPATRLAYSVPGEAADVLGVSVDFFADYIAHELRIVRRGQLRLVAATERLTDTIAIQSAVVEDLRQRLHWRRQLPLQIALLLTGAVISYLLGLWNPLA